MKTMITTFAIAVMVLTPMSAYATEESNRKTKEVFDNFAEDTREGWNEHMVDKVGGWFECMTDYKASQEGRPTKCDQFSEAEIDELEGFENDIEREVADSGNEGSTSSASASDQ